MTTQKTKLLTVAIAGLLIFLHQSAHAEESNLHLKSETAAWILGLDPIPGDALIYAGKGFQGTISFFVGSAFAVPFYLMVQYTVTGGPEHCRNSGGDSWCINDPTALLLITGIPYVSTLVWDGIVGIRGVKKHNAHVRQKTSLLQTMQPIVSVMPDGGYAGVQFKF